MNFQIVPAQDTDIPAIQEVYEDSSRYFYLVDGLDVVPLDMGAMDFYDTPPKKSATYEKCFCLILKDGLAGGVVDLHKDHPDRGTTYIGLLMLRQGLQGKGYGRQIYADVERFAKVALGATRLRVGVSVRNDVRPFWQKMGFKPNGKTYQWQGMRITAEVVEMDKDLGATSERI